MGKRPCACPWRVCSIGTLSRHIATTPLSPFVLRHSFVIGASAFVIQPRRGRVPLLRAKCRRCPHRRAWIGVVGLAALPVPRRSRSGRCGRKPRADRLLGCKLIAACFPLVPHPWPLRPDPPSAPPREPPRAKEPQASARATTARSLKADRCSLPPCSLFPNPQPPTPDPCSLLPLPPPLRSVTLPITCLQFLA